MLRAVPIPDNTKYIKWNKYQINLLIKFFNVSFNFSCLLARVILLSLYFDFKFLEFL